MKMEVAALVMGIIGLVCNFFGTGTVVGPICSVLAIIFGVIGMKKNTDKRGMAKAGMIRASALYISTDFFKAFFAFITKHLFS